MKALLIFIALGATLPALAQTATNNAELQAPFKGSGVIVIHSVDSAKVAYVKLARLLLADGYALDKADKDLGFINTNYRATANKAIESALRFVISPQSNGSTIELRGVYRMPGMSHTLMAGDSPIEMRGAPSSPVGRGWEEMARVATLYPNATIGYKRLR